MRQATRFALLALVALLVGVSAFAPLHPATAAREGSAPERPNIVYILTDDMSADLLPYLTEVTQLRREGTSPTTPAYGRMSPAIATAGSARSWTTSRGPSPSRCRTPATAPG